MLILGNEQTIHSQWHNSCESAGSDTAQTKTNGCPYKRSPDQQPGQNFRILAAEAMQVCSAVEEVESLDEDHDVERDTCKTTNVEEEEEEEEEIFAENTVFTRIKDDPHSQSSIFRKITVFTLVRSGFYVTHCLHI
jgi:hypothetical protein